MSEVPVHVRQSHTLESMKCTWQHTCPDRRESALHALPSSDPYHNGRVCATFGRYPEFQQEVNDVSDSANGVYVAFVL